MFNTDAKVFLADMASATSWTPSGRGATLTGPMLFDRPEDVIDSGDVQSRQYQVTFETAAWPGLKRAEVLAIAGDGGGGNYKLRTDPRTLDDGVLSVVGLTKV